jgi:hypothetical protein
VNVGGWLESEPFHAIALFAFVEQAMAQGGWPDCEATRRRAYAYYEQELALRTQNAPPRADSERPYLASTV